MAVAALWPAISLAQTPVALTRVRRDTRATVIGADVIRQQRIEVANLDALADPQRSAVLRLELFSDLTVDALREYQEATAHGEIWVGVLRGYPTSTVVLAVAGDELIAHVYSPIGFFRIEREVAATYVVQQVDQESLPSGRDAVVAIEAVTDLPSPTWVTAADDGTVIDVLVAYTRDALSAFGSESRALATVDLIVAETNQALRATGARARIRLVHSTAVDYIESGNSSSDLDRLTRNDDGHLDVLHTLRDRYAADVVALITNNMERSNCGRAFLASLRSGPSWAFSVTVRDCTRNGRTFAHELGHNLGAHHDWYETAEAGAHSYAKGFVSLAGRFLDVMAYYNLCVDTGTTCEAVLAYSNPANRHSGHPFGVAIGTSTACTRLNRNNPQCDSDIARSLEEMSPIVARYRDSRTSLAKRQILPAASLSSDNGQYRLTLQTDGNLVLVETRTGSAVWATGTSGFRPREAVVQTDGNFVLYDANGCPRWATGTGGNPNAYLLIQNDGNVVIYRSDEQPLWDRNRDAVRPSC